MTVMGRKRPLARSSWLGFLCVQAAQRTAVGAARGRLRRSGSPFPGSFFSFPDAALSGKVGCESESIGPARPACFHRKMHRRAIWSTCARVVASGDVPPHGTFSASPWPAPRWRRR